MIAECLGCKGTRFSFTRDLVELDLRPAHRISGNTYTPGRWPWSRMREEHGEPLIMSGSVHEIHLGKLARCVACGLQQLATPAGMQHIGVSSNEDSEGGSATREDAPEGAKRSEEPKPPLRTVLDKDIPLRRKKPYA